MKKSSWALDPSIARSLAGISRRREADERRQEGKERVQPVQRDTAGLQISCMMKHNTYGQVCQRAYWLYQLPATTRAHTPLSESTNNQFVDTENKHTRETQALACAFWVLRSRCVRVHASIRAGQACCAAGGTYEVPRRTFCASVLSLYTKWSLEPVKIVTDLSALATHLFPRVTSKNHHVSLSSRRRVARQMPAFCGTQEKVVQALPVFSPRSKMRRIRRRTRLYKR
jgi:hypothetical protein